MMNRSWQQLLPLPLIVTCLALFVPASAPAAEAVPMIAGCPVFPADSVWNTPVDQLPVDVNSAAYIATIGATTGLHPDFGAGLWEGAPIGIPFTVVTGDQPKVPISFDYDDESDPGPYPVPSDAPIEGGSGSTGDRHVLVLERDSCILYEMFASYPQGNGSWTAGSGAVFDLRSHALRPAGWTSADAAGLPILPGLVRYEEMAAGEINHAIRFTASRTRNTYLWPARHKASSNSGTTYPPMGQRFRLKSSFDISGYAPQVRVILRAMQKYGIILADNGGNWYISGVPDPGWDDDTLVSQLRSVKGSDFEAVDESSLRISVDSGRTNRTDCADGDLNGDGKTSVLDVILALRIVTGRTQADGAALFHGDVDPRDGSGRPAPDGRITLADALLLLQKAVGLMSW